MALPLHDWYYGAVTANGVTWPDSPTKPNDSNKDCNELPQKLTGDVNLVNR